jgi:membrane associated rhomboid family serine protease
LRPEPPRWTYIFIAVSVIGFIFQAFTNLWVYLAFFPAFAFESPWMFITSIFLHADLEHLLFNMIALFFLGINLERMVGRRNFAMLFIASGLIGNLGYLLTANNPLIPAIGASGAVYGIMGTLAVLVPRMRIFIYGIIPVPMIVLAIIWGLMDFMGLFAPSGIAHGAHLGGMFVGVAYGLYIRLKMSRRVVVI